MTNDLPTPDAHAQGWRLLTRDANIGKSWLDASDMDPPLLLVLDTQSEWWAVTPECRHCGAPLVGALKKQAGSNGLDEVLCGECRTAHGPAVEQCRCVALMVVDDEIYAAPD